MTYTRQSPPCRQASSNTIKHRYKVHVYGVALLRDKLTRPLTSGFKARSEWKRLRDQTVCTFRGISGDGVTFPEAGYPRFHVESPQKPGDDNPKGIACDMLPRTYPPSISKANRRKLLAWLFRKIPLWDEIFHVFSEYLLVRGNSPKIGDDTELAGIMNPRYVLSIL